MHIKGLKSKHVTKKNLESNLDSLKSKFKEHWLSLEEFNLFLNYIEQKINN